MVFKPVNAFRQEKSFLQYAVVTQLTVYRGKANPRISRRVCGTSDSIELEVDTENRVIRLRTGKGLTLKLAPHNHTFSLPVKLRVAIVPPGVKSIQIPLELRDDGWWYGNYGGPL